MKAIKTTIIALACALLMGSHRAAAAEEMQFGVLPVLQALPIFVAAEQGFFEQAGLELEVVPFQSAAEKDIALKAGAIDGYFGDLFTPLVVEGNGLDIAIVATNYRTGADTRMFAVLASKQSGITDVAGLKGHDVGISTASVIDYVTQQLLGKGGDPADVELLDMKNIGLRMQMLMSGELDAATLPEPLVTAAEKGGAVVLADDTGMLVSQTVLVFRQDYLDGNAGAVKGFLAAVDEANKWISEHPAEAREMMIKHTRLPEPLQQVFPVPVFPTKMDVPSSTTIAEVLAWLKAEGIVKKDLTYTGLVNGDYLP
ncbi:MAG: ABC transporter substrate-binding protein [Planctomycetales bacterium]|nr:ABC transporter substrate-binding protein [bacterium]UNM07197.1 MAG: ABC transporter substrate-binding protein [Planctomycetales bacterium]